MKKSTRRRKAIKELEHKSEIEFKQKKLSDEEYKEVQNKIEVMRSKNKL